MAAEGDFMRYIITGEEDEDIPLDATHFSVHESVNVIPGMFFFEHPNIVELICHAGVERIQRQAFFKCHSLKRVIIPGLEVVGGEAFRGCRAVTDIECPNLEIIGELAFDGCFSLSDINLLAVNVVELGAFQDCHAIKGVKFGKKLESIEGMAFYQCHSLERITIPLKNGLIAHDNIFQGCEDLHRVDLVGKDELRETINALLAEEWRNDMNETIDSINYTLPDTDAGGVGCGEEGGKARAIRRWIASVLRKIIHYKAQHRSLVQEIATALQFELPADAVINYVLPCLELPKHTFDGEDQVVDDEDVVVEAEAIDLGENSGSNEEAEAEGEEVGEEENVLDDEALNRVADAGVIPEEAIERMAMMPPSSRRFEAILEIARGYTELLDMQQRHPNDPLLNNARVALGAELARATAAVVAAEGYGEESGGIGNDD